MLKPPTTSASLRTPEEWARVEGTRAWHFAAAAQLHGWREHAYHEGRPMQLSRAAYRAALAAAVARKHRVTPARDAVSKHRGKGT